MSGFHHLSLWMSGLHHLSLWMSGFHHLSLWMSGFHPLRPRTRMGGRPQDADLAVTPYTAGVRG